MKHTAILKEHELTWNMMNQVWELTAIIETDGKDMQLYVPLSKCPRRIYKKLREENKKLKELLKECEDVIETSVWGNCSELTDRIDEVIGEK